MSNNKFSHKSKSLVAKSSRAGGFVSIFVVLLIMMVLVLVTTGFSNVTRRAQRRTLDNQLSTQAFYAAESGINDAIARLNSGTASGLTPKTDCQSPEPTFFDYKIDTTLNVGYSCVLINPKPPLLSFSNVPVSGYGAPIVLPFEPEGGFNGEFDITWSSASGVGSIPTSSTPVFENVVDWGTKLGLVRVDIVPVTDKLGRSGVATGTYSFILYPSSTGTSTVATIDSGTANQGQTAMIQCGATATECTANIQLKIPKPPTTSKYFIRLQSFYNATSIKVENVENSSGVKTVFANGQAIIDVTGQASDVYRRVQVFVPIDKQGARSAYNPSYALETADSLCKVILVGDTEVTLDSYTPIDTRATNGACAID
jgi:hypothetical protein